MIYCKRNLIIVLLVNKNISSLKFIYGYNFFKKVHIFVALLKKTVHNEQNLFIDSL